MISRFARCKPPRTLVEIPVGGSPTEPLPALQLTALAIGGAANPPIPGGLVCSTNDFSTPAVRSSFLPSSFHPLLVAPPIPSRHCLSTSCAYRAALTGCPPSARMSSLPQIDVVPGGRTLVVPRPSIASRWLTTAYFGFIPALLFVSR